MVTIEYIKSVCSSLGIEEEIKVDTSFNELNIDSLTIVELLSKIEIDYNITIPWSSYDSSMKIYDFVNKINKL